MNWFPEGGEYDVDFKFGCEATLLGAIKGSEGLLKASLENPLMEEFKFNKLDALVNFGELG